MSGRLGRTMISIAAIFGTSVLGAQSTIRFASVRGLAYDSLSGKPLANAFILIGGSVRSAVSDSQGRFRFDSVVPGSYTFVLQHDVLDSIGLSGRTVRVAVDRANQPLQIAVPSFNTLWRAVCGGAVPKGDSGLVYGYVRASSGDRSIPGAKVGVSWTEVGYTRGAGFDQKSWGAEVVADSTGRYALCGVPRGSAITIVAANDSLISARDPFPPTAIRVVRRDLVLIGPPNPSLPDGERLGSVVGHVVAGDQRPLAGAIVSTEGVPETRTGEDGHFILRGVPTGVRRVEARAIGKAPVAVSATVRPADSTIVLLQLRDVTVLDEINVKARTVRDFMLRDIQERRRLGLGYFRDSAAIEKLPNMPSVFDGFAGIRVRRGRGADLAITNLSGTCPLAIWIDKAPSDGVDLYLLQPDGIAAIEVYPRPTFTPIEFQRRRHCGAVVVWTKRFLR